MNVKLIKILEIEIEKSERKDINNLLNLCVIFDTFKLRLYPSFKNDQYFDVKYIDNQRILLSDRNDEFIKKESITKDEYINLRNLFIDKVNLLTDDYLNNTYLEFPQAPKEL